MRETRSSGSVEGVMSNRDPYSDSLKSVLTGIQRSQRIQESAILLERGAVWPATAPFD